MSSPLQNNITNLQNLLDKVNTLPEAGTDLPELTNEGSESDLMLNKELIDADGNIVTGTFTIDSELSTQNDLIAQIQSVVDSLPNASSGGTNNEIETVNVVCNYNSEPDTGIWYIDETCTLRYNSFRLNQQYAVMKNTIFVIDYDVNRNSVGGATYITGDSSYGVFKATG